MILQPFDKLMVVSSSTSSPSRAKSRDIVEPQVQDHGERSRTMKKILSSSVFKAYQSLRLLFDPAVEGDPYKKDFHGSEKQIHADNTSLLLRRRWILR